jgi:hypothetical protein
MHKVRRRDRWFAIGRERLQQPAQALESVPSLGVRVQVVVDGSACFHVKGVQEIPN